MHTRGDSLNNQLKAADHAAGGGRSSPPQPRAAYARCRGGRRWSRRDIQGLGDTDGACDEGVICPGAKSPRAASCWRMLDIDYNIFFFLFLFLFLLLSCSGPRSAVGSESRVVFRTLICGTGAFAA